MPKKGFKSITIHTSDYDRLDSIYKELKELGTLPLGIRSLSGYVSYRFGHHVKEKQHLKNLASKIEFVPKKFTKTITVIDVPKGDKQD